MTQKRHSEFAFPFFVGLMLALMIAIYSAFFGDPQSAAAQEQPTPNGEDSRAPQTGETRVEGWLSVVYGDPLPESGQAGARLVTLQDSGGADLVEVAMPEGTLQMLYGQYVEVIGTPRAEPRALNGTLINARLVTPIAPQRGEGLRDARVSGSQPWINLLCRFSDRPAEPNPPSFYQNLFSTAYPGLDHYWRQISYNNINLSGTATVTAWGALPQPRSFYITGSGSGATANLNALISDCVSLHDANVFYPAYIGINMFFNDSLDCCAWGGGRYLNVDGQGKFYRTTWLPPWAANHGVIAHEMGHGYGFPHSTGPANNPPTGLNVYVSQWDVMSDFNGTSAVSVSGYGALAPGTISYNLRMARWIPSGRIVTVGSGQDVTLMLERTVLPQSTTNPLMAVVPIGGSTSQFYTVEVRSINAGYDQNIPASAVIIHDVNTARTGNGGYAYVVDADTNNTNTNDAGARWLPGETYIDYARRISIEVLSQSGSTFTVRIINGISNLVRNGDFTNGGAPPNTPPQFWSIFGAPTNPIWNVTGGVFQFYRQLNSTQGVIFQNLSAAIPSGTLIETRVDLGNSSGQRKRAVIMLHDSDFSDLFMCSFWLPPNTPLTTFRMTGRAQRSWTNATISIYAAMADNLPHLRVDNAFVAVIADDGSSSVLCYDPFAP